MRLKRKPRGTDGSLLRSLPWSMTALAVATLPHLPHLPVWVSAALILCGAWRMVIEKRRMHLPHAGARVLLALSCFLGVLFTYGNITGVGPGSVLLVLMGALKLLETRQHRDQFVLLFISLFLTMSALLREQHIWSLPYMLFSLTVTMTAWLQMSAHPQTRITQNLAVSGRLLTLAAPIALVMWVFFPRLSSPFWAVPIDAGKARSGISDTMSPGDISSLSLSNDVAFRVDFIDSIPPQQELYWRGLVLDEFNGRAWKGNKGRLGDTALWDIDYIGEPVRYRITMEPTAQRWLFALDTPHEWSLTDVYRAPQLQLLRQRPIDQRLAYTASSYTRYRSDSNMRRLMQNFYRALPPNDNPRTAALAQRMRDAADNPQSFVRTVLQMFRDQDFYYTLQPPALGANSVDQFLFVTRRGFCEHYASAFAVMMRAAGVPARIVLGYQGGEYNALGNYLIVRQSDAHAWTEIWLPNEGWVRIDPTAAVAPERIESGMSGMMFDAVGAAWGLSSPSKLLHRLTLAWDAANAKWNELVLGYGPENQNRLMKWLGMDDPDWRKMMTTMLILVALLVFAVSMLLVARYRPPRKDEAARLYRRFVSRVGEEPRTGETPYAYLQRVAKQAQEQQALATSVTEHYLQTRYGAPGINQLSQLRDDVRQFRQCSRVA